MTVTEVMGYRHIPPVFGLPLQKWRYQQKTPLFSLEIFVPSSSIDSSSTYMIGVMEQSFRKGQKRVLPLSIATIVQYR